MTRRVMNAGRRWSAIGLLMLTAAGCATGQSVSKGEDAAKKGDWDSAVAYYREAVAADPKAIEARVGLERAMREAAMAHITRAKKFEAGSSGRAPRRNTAWPLSSSRQTRWR